MKPEGKGWFRRLVTKVTGEGTGFLEKELTFLSLVNKHVGQQATSIDRALHGFLKSAEWVWNVSREILGDGARVVGIL